MAAISHRGEHLRHPENTMPAYRAALEAGADFIETDVRTTADGRLVIMHDATVDRCTDGHAEVAAMTFDAIRKLDAGGRFDPAFRGTAVPAFEEVLEFARGKIGVYIDAKRISAPDLTAAVRKFGMQDQVVVYGSLELLRGVAKLEAADQADAGSGSLEVVARIIGELRPRVIAFDARDFQDPILAVAREAKADIYVDRLGSADTPASWEDAIRRAPLASSRTIRPSWWSSCAARSSTASVAAKFIRRFLLTTTLMWVYPGQAGGNDRCSPIVEVQTASLARLRWSTACRRISAPSAPNLI